MTKPSQENAERRRGFFEETIPQAARAYISGVILLGAPLFAYSLYRASTDNNFHWLYLVALTVITSCFPVRLPLLKTNTQSFSITVSDVFIFSAILLFGPFVAAIVAVMEGLISSLRLKVKRMYKRLFNGAQLAIVAFIVGRVFEILQAGTGNLAAGRLTNVDRLLFEAVICGLLYFGLNSTLVAVAMSLVMRQPLGKLWRKNFLWAPPANFANASTAAIFFVQVPPVDFSATFAIIPLALVLYYAHRVNQYRLKEKS